MKYLVAIALICVALVGELAQAARSSSDDWTLFKKQHRKSYESPAEDARRFAIFTATKQRVERHNSQGNSSFKMGLSHLSDWTQEELAKLNGLKGSESALVRAQERLNETEAYLAQILGSSSEPVPDELDWRKVPGRVSFVHDQGDCSADWAFATVGVLEGQEMVRVFNKTSEFVRLSAQEAIDCSRSNKGCLGGSVPDALDDLATLGGIMAYKDYPLCDSHAKCCFDKRYVLMTEAGHVILPARDETKLKQVLARFGPVSIAMHATENLINYRSGVLDDKTCSSDAADLNRAMLLVGYGTDPNEGDYWIVKNWWGFFWGQRGYFKIRRGVNMCGIAVMPTIAKF